MADNIDINDYDINTNPGTANAVASGAFKFVASLLPSLLQYYEQSGTKVRDSIVNLSKYLV